MIIVQLYSSPYEVILLTYQMHDVSVYFDQWLSKTHLLPYIFIEEVYFNNFWNTSTYTVVLEFNRLSHFGYIHCLLRFKLDWTEAESNPIFFDSIHLRFIPHKIQFGSVSNFDIDFTNFRFIFNMKLPRENKFVRLYDMLQFKNIHCPGNAYFWLWSQCQIQIPHTQNP